MLTDVTNVVLLYMDIKNTQSEQPAFLLKATLGVACVGLLMLLPFVINNYMQGRLALAYMPIPVIILCVVNIYLCWRGNYSVFINTWLLVPALVLAVANTILNQGSITTYWAFPVILAVYFMLPLRRAIVANVLTLVIMNAAAYLSVPQDIFLRFTLISFGLSIFAFLSLREITRQHHTLKALVRTDPMTKLNNRLMLEYYVNDAIEQAKRNNREMSILAADLDHFKKINDQYGHDVGDRVICEVADMMRSNCRKSDVLFRLGGEEFLILLRDSNKENALQVAERLRLAIANASIIEGHQVTLSVGLADLSLQKTWKDWLKQADDCLYEAKSLGRNRVVTSLETAV